MPVPRSVSTGSYSQRKKKLNGKGKVRRSILSSETLAEAGKQCGALSRGRTESIEKIPGHWEKGKNDDEEEEEEDNKNHVSSWGNRGMTVGA